MAGNKGMESMILTINLLQDKLNPFGINLGMDLPQIAVVGGQSAGKSSVLESFVGKEFLPRGSGIVTRRPLILQLISNDGLYGEFLHLPDRRFSNFDDIRREIEAETDRETSGNKGISPKPINLKIYSPDVVDLTLIDLPGLTRVPVGNQPQDIEIQIRKMILSFITRENCLILAVTAANQDLATSDALQLAKETDPDGKRTIGVLTKMDLMDDGTDARDILDGKLLPLKRGYIGVINRSQKDIDSKKSIIEALASESKYFSDHSKYWDISDRLGTSYLQKFLNKELSTHIFKQLPSLRDMFQSKSSELEDKLETLDLPQQTSDLEKTLSEISEQLRRDFEVSIGRSSSVKVDVEKLSGGTIINSLMNERYPNEVNAIFYDENKLRLEIAVSIQNIHGVHLGMFTPDMAFEAVIRHQIEQLLDPSLRCIDWVTRELENVIKACVRNIQRYPRVREVFSSLTLKFIRECQKECKSRMQYMVAVQSAYMNTIHEDFVGIKSGEQMLHSYNNPKSQFTVSAALNNKHILNRGWISYKRNHFWFVLQNDSLLWYRDEEEKDKKGSMSLNEFKVKTGKDDKTLVLTILNKKNVFNECVKDNNKQMELLFNSSLNVEKWKESLVDAGVKSNDSDNNFYAIDNDSDTYSVSNMPLTNGQTNGQMPQKYPEMPTKPLAEELSLRITEVDVVQKLVDSYVKILKKTFKDYVPKLLMLALINATKTFIAVDLKLRARDLISSVEDIMGEDPDEEMQKNLIIELNSYKDAIVIIDEVLLQK